MLSILADALFQRVGLGIISVNLLVAHRLHGVVGRWSVAHDVIVSDVAPLIIHHGLVVIHQVADLAARKLVRVVLPKARGLLLLVHLLLHLGQLLLLEQKLLPLTVLASLLVKLFFALWSGLCPCVFHLRLALP